MEGLVKQVLCKLQFKYNQSHLDQLDDETLNDDVMGYILVINVVLWVRIEWNWVATIFASVAGGHRQGRWCDAWGHVQNCGKLKRHSYVWDIKEILVPTFWRKLSDIRMSKRSAESECARSRTRHKTVALRYAWPFVLAASVGTSGWVSFRWTLHDSLQQFLSASQKVSRVLNVCHLTLSVRLVATCTYGTRMRLFDPRADIGDLQTLRGDFVELFVNPFQFLNTVMFNADMRRTWPPSRHMRTGSRNFTWSLQLMKRRQHNARSWSPTPFLPLCHY